MDRAFNRTQLMLEVQDQPQQVIQASSERFMSSISSFLVAKPNTVFTIECFPETQKDDSLNLPCFNPLGTS